MELMMVLQIEVSKCYTPDAYKRVAAMRRVPEFPDTRLDGKPAVVNPSLLT